MEHVLANPVLLATVDALWHNPRRDPVSTVSACFKELLLRHSHFRAVARGEL